MNKYKSYYNKISYKISIDEKKIINDFSDINEDNYNSHILKIISLWKIDNNKKYV